jgi:hypothetical protein
MRDQQPPQIRMGMQIPLTTKPFMGKKRANLVICVVNALLKSLIKTGATNPQVLVAQNGGFLFNIPGVEGSSGGGYRGTYDAAVTYNAGDIVRTMSGSTVTGLWGCVAVAPITGVTPVEGTSWHSLSTGGGSDPVWLP